MMRQVSFIFLVPMMDLTLSEMLFFCILFFFVNVNRDISMRFKFEVIHKTSDTILRQIFFFLVNWLWYFFFLLRRPNKRCTLVFNRSLGWFRYRWRLLSLRLYRLDRLLDMWLSIRRLCYCLFLFCFLLHELLEELASFNLIEIHRQGSRRGRLRYGRY